MPENWFWYGVKAITGAIIGIWLSAPAAVKLLVILFGFDLVSCLFTHRASVKSTLRRFAVTMLLSLAVHILYASAKELTGFNVGFDLGAAVALYYVFGETIELALNCSTVIDLPPWLMGLLEKAQGMTGKQRRTIESQNHTETPLPR